MWRNLSRLASFRSFSFSRHAIACEESSLQIRCYTDQYLKPDDIVGEYSPVTRSLWFERSKRNKVLDSSRRLPDPIAKPPQETAVTYSFSSDAALRDQYKNPWGHARIGRLLEDLDALSGNIAFVHCDDDDAETRPPLLVTASVDRIMLRRRLTLDSDLTMAGKVVWTGRSALDIRMELRQEGFDDPSMTALFTFVARDPITRKSMAVNPLQPSTEPEKALFAERQAVADERRAQRQARSQGDLSGMAANMEWAESLLSEARAAIDLPALAAPDAVLMRDTGLQNTFICQPQQRNMAGRIFGGFLMRRAYELAFATCYMFAGVRPVFQEVDEVTFEKPVSIGDLLRFRSHVLHTARSPDDPSQGRVHIEVVTTIVQPEATSSNISNMFNFNFSVTQRPLPDASPTPLKRVLPSTTEEAARIWDYYPGST